jgi:hypothetical protein
MATVTSVCERGLLGDAEGSALGFQEREKAVSLNVSLRRFCEPAVSGVSRRRLRALVVGLVAVVALPLVVSSSALATTGYAPAGQFGGTGSGDGQFNFLGPNGLAVSQSSGDVYGSDPYGSPSPRVQRFDASGTFVSAFSLPAGYSTPGALATDAGGSVYVSAVDSATFGAAVLKFSAAGTLEHALNVGSSGVTITSGARVAVDPVDGTVFVAATDAGVPVVATFDGGTGAFVSSFDGSNGSPDGTFGCVSGLAIDAAHRLYVVDGCDSRVYRYAADGAFVATVDDGSRGTPAFVAVDPVSGEVFVAASGSAGVSVTSFSAGGVSAGASFGQGSIFYMGGLAVGHDSATVYVGDAAVSAVKRFVAFEGPTVTTTTSAPVDGSSQTLNGTIDPEGVSATYHFDYGTSTAYGSSTAESDPVSGTDPLPATATATGLTPNTTYHFRIVGTNASGSISGEDQTFTTAAAPPVLNGSPAFASAITPTEATLNATLNPSGSATTYHFEYGTPTGYALSSDSAVSGAGAADETVSVPLTGLTAGTTYHYRLVADNGTGGVQHGADGVFHTAPATPVSATNVTVYGASLNGVVNPHGAATTYRFDYGTSAAYGRSTAEADAGSTDGEKAVAGATGELAPDTTYHFRLVSTSNGQTTSSEDRTFTTGAVPLVVAKDASGISLNGATLNGTVDTHGKDGTYQFSVDALDRSYEKVTEPQPVSSTEPKTVSATVSELPAGTAFRVRLSITSNGTTKTSDQVVFATPARQNPPPRPPFADQGSPYGCAAPVLNAYDARPKPGETITITGKDLGSGGTIALGTNTTISSWSSTSFTVQVPEDAAGTLALTVNCGQLSNTIAVAIYQEPSNAFSITKTSVKGSTATLSLKLPGVGKVQTSAKSTKATTTTITKAGTVKVKVKLSSAGAKALKKSKSRKLTVTARIRYTPAGGTTATETVSVTYTRKAGR